MRCIPFDSFVPGDKEPGKCMVTGKPSTCRVVFARSYWYRFLYEVFQK
ncbi:hypothetical protein [Mesomycoplasma ovipneumoniae]